MNRYCGRVCEPAIWPRYGGEEFILLLPGADRDGRAWVAERLRRSIEAMTVQVPTAAISVTASFGVAQLEAADTSADQVARADSGLYAAKRSGRNRVVYVEVTSSAIASAG